MPYTIFFLYWGSLYSLPVHRDESVAVWGSIETLVYRDAVGYEFIVYSTGTAVDDHDFECCWMSV